MNKKYAVIIGIGITIAAIAFASYQYLSSSKEEMTDSQNLGQGNHSVTTSGKHYSIELHESIGITTRKP